MKKRLRKKKAKWAALTNLEKSIAQAVRALNGDYSQVTTHVVSLKDSDLEAANRHNDSY